ncbi:hypothetical protein BJV78DRAFT_1374585 [Lactifluus subvellereus]|nr:hypothetical protein BJV78DRAFT_1374585 [Lactifluus subvellereus]
MMATAPPQDSTVPKKGRGVVPPRALAPARAVTRHDEFYFTDEMTVFQVENRLFRVHRHFLAENSLVFSSMFSLPREPTDSSSAEGTCDTNPIYLSGVTELEFETLLRYFYNSMHDGFSLPQTSWIALLSITHRYDFPNVRERAIREVYGTAATAEQQQDHLLLLSVAEKYDVPPERLLPSLIALVMRPQPLTEDEVALFSALTISRLAHAREEFVRATPDLRRLPPAQSVHFLLVPSPPNSQSRKEDIAKDVVYKIWQIQKGDLH